MESDLAMLWENRDNKLIIDELEKSRVERIKERGVTIMHDMKAPGWGVITAKASMLMLAAFGALNIIYWAGVIKEDDGLFGVALKGFEPREYSYMKQLGRHCFSKLPWGGNHEDCVVWNNEHIGMVSGFYRDIKPFEDQAQTEAKEDLKRHRELEAQAKPINPTSGEGSVH